MAADTSGSWLTLAADFEAPELSISVLVSFVVGIVDVLFFGDTDLLFADGFESGDVSAWSSQSP